MFVSLNEVPRVVAKEHRDHSTRIERVYLSLSYKLWRTGTAEGAPGLPMLCSKFELVVC